ncbi:MAG: ATP-binding protein [Bacteroidales bacterium]|nr:ATP-binding protein [Bacteroidales bacterium]MDT8432571.1 ATP-binding protein [Bacteroidales bacterium]
MKTPQTPFPLTGYHGPEFFCDREQELEQLLSNIRGNQLTTLVALRRLGKTALIHHLFHHLGKGYIKIYIDILPTESLNDLLNQLSTAMISQYSERSNIGKRIWQLIRSLRPVISYDALNGAPQVMLKTTPVESKKTISEIFAVLEEQSKPVVIAIDEFQQILEYPEKQTDAWLRSVVQQLRNVNFIFSGSQQHLMTDLFTNPARPFFRSTSLLKIGKIDAESYAEFILGQFKKQAVSISAETVTEILNWTNLHTWYVQLLCSKVILTTEKTVTSGTWKKEAIKILKEQEFVFYGYREMLTKAQWGLLKAIARDITVYQPTSSEFIARHQLGNASTVLQSLRSLIDKELVYRELNENGETYYGIYDILLGQWLLQKDPRQ